MICPASLNISGDIDKQSLRSLPNSGPVLFNDMHWSMSGWCSKPCWLWTLQLMLTIMMMLVLHEELQASCSLSLLRSGGGRKVVSNPTAAGGLYTVSFVVFKAPAGLCYLFVCSLQFSGIQILWGKKKKMLLSEWTIFYFLKYSALQKIRSNS